MVDVLERKVAQKPVSRRFTPSAWLAAVGTLLLLTVLALVEPRTFLWDDNLSQFLPWYEFNYQSLIRGEIPQINFYQYLGQTYLSNGQNGFFYPPVLLAMCLGHLVGNPELGIEWLGWFHLAAAVLVIERLAREYGVAPLKSVLVAWLFVTCPCILCSSQAWDLHAYVALYTSLTFLQLERLQRKPSVPRFIQLGLIKALFILCGHLNYFALSLLYEGLFILLRSISVRRFIGTTALWLGSILLGALGSLPSLGPVLYHLGSAADRGASMPLTRVLELAIPPLDIPAAQAGLFLTDPDAFYVYQAAWYFFGGALFFWPLMALYWRDNSIRSFSLMMAAALVFCTEAFFLIHLLPGYHSFRWAGKSLMFAVTFYVIAAGLVCERLGQSWARLPGILLGISIAMNLIVNSSPGTRIRNAILPRHEPYFHLPLEQLSQGRSQVMTLSNSNKYNPDFLTFDFATLARVPAFNGYDALVSVQNKREALNEEYSGLPWHALSSDEVKHRREWSVRFYLFDKIAADPPKNAPETQTWVRAGTFGPVVIWEDPGAAPLAYFEDEPTQALPVRMEGNRLIVGPGSETRALAGRILSLGWVPLPGYTEWLQNPVTKRPECPATTVPASDSGRMKFPVPSSGGEIVIQYDEPFLNWYLFVTGITYFTAAICVYLSIRLKYASPSAPSLLS